MPFISLEGTYFFIKRPTIKMMIANTTKIIETPLNHVFLPMSTKAIKIDNNITITAESITFVEFIVMPTYYFIKYNIIENH